MVINPGKYLPLLLIFFITGCAKIKNVSKTELQTILQTTPENWTIADCNSVIKCYTYQNKEGFFEKNKTDKSFSSENVYITAIPLNSAVICAMVRKEAIQKRYTQQRYRERLKEYFDNYTRFTVDSISGKIQYNFMKPVGASDEMSFIVTFENISVPYHSIEVNRAEEGFFLENLKGEFTRVLKSYSNYDSEDLLINNEARLILTFSLIKDDGMRINLSSQNTEKYRLVFNGLQDDAIIVTSE